MDRPTRQLVPKVHPATREVEPDDPMSLHATVIPGDPEVMVRAVVQEYAWMGWNAEAILALFRDPTHPALRGMWLILGEDGIRRRISAALQTRGVYQLRSTIHEAPDEPDVVSIGGLVGRPRRPEEVSHASGL